MIPPEELRGEGEEKLQCKNELLEAGPQHSSLVHFSNLNKCIKNEINRDFLKLFFIFQVLTQLIKSGLVMSPVTPNE